MQSLRRYSILFAVLATTGCGGAAKAKVQGEPTPIVASSRGSCPIVDTTIVRGAAIYTACGVDREARLVGRGPQLDFRPSGSASCYRGIIDVVVDERGRTIPETAKVIRASETQFADAMLRALPGLNFTPATKDGIQVKQVFRWDMGAAITVVRSDQPTARAPRAPRC